MVIITVILIRFAWMILGGVHRDDVFKLHCVTLSLCIDRSQTILWQVQWVFPQADAKFSAKRYNVPVSLLPTPHHHHPTPTPPPHPHTHTTTPPPPPHTHTTTTPTSCFYQQHIKWWEPKYLEKFEFVSSSIKVISSDKWSLLFIPILSYLQSDKL